MTHARYLVSKKPLQLTNDLSAIHSGLCQMVWIDAIHNPWNSCHVDPEGPRDRDRPDNTLGPAHLILACFDGFGRLRQEDLRIISSIEFFPHVHKMEGHIAGLKS